MSISYIANKSIAAKTLSSSAPKISRPAWVRNPAWLSLPDVTGQQKFVGLHRIDEESNYVSVYATTSAGTYTVDWGDGTIENFTSGVQAYHQYDYVTYDAGNTTLVTHEQSAYKQAIVTITATTGNLTGVDINRRHNAVGLSASVSSGWLDIAVEGGFIASLVISGSTINAQHRQLEKAYIGTIADTAHPYLFSGCSTLESVYFHSNFSVTDASYMFYACYSLTTVPLFNTAAVTNMTQMFYVCYSLTTVPLFNTAACTNMTQMFYACYSLTTVPLFNTAAVTDASYMFQYCTSLTTVPLFNTAAVTNMSYMFQSCYSLTTVPLFNTAAVTNMTQMFYACYSLTTVPLFNTAAVTNMTQMFQSCYSLTTVPLFNTAAVTNMTQMFYACYSLTTVPLFNTAAVTNMTQMFYVCYSLTTVPLFNTAAVTNMSYMFQYCTSLTTVPLFNTAAVTNMSYMFQSCYSLTTVPLFNTAAVTNMTQMFQYCYSLTTVPLFNTGAISSAANITSIFANCYSLSKIAFTGLKYTFSVAGCKLSKAALELVCANLGIGSAATLTITTNPGLDTAVSKTACGTTLGSTLITQTNTASLAVGMSITGTGAPVTTAIACTFTDAGDLVNLTAHGLSNGDIVAFPSITATTGIIAFQTYYVVNVTANTFQISATLGGSALPLTNNGTGTLKYNAKIVSIVTNTSVTLDRPCTATGSQTLSFRLLNTSQALLKGWTVTG